jgi:hypothetical protein
MRLRPPHRTSRHDCPQARPAHFPVIHVRSARDTHVRSAREIVPRKDLARFGFLPTSDRRFQKKKKGEQEIRDRRIGANASNYNQRTRIERFSVHYPEIYNRRRLPPARDRFLGNGYPTASERIVLARRVCSGDGYGWVLNGAYRVSTTLEDENASRRQKCE